MLPGSGVLPQCVTSEHASVVWDGAAGGGGQRGDPWLLCLPHKFFSLAVVGSGGVWPEYSLSFLQGKFAAQADFLVVQLSH